MAFKIGNQTVIQDIDASAVIETNSNLDKLQIGGVDVFTHDGASPPKITLKNVDIADLTEASINTDNVTEGSTNLFFTDARAVSALTSTTSALAADIGTNTGNINTKLPLAGGTLTGALTLSGAPTNANHASTKAYVDSSISSGTSSLDTDDIAEAGNLYYTDARVNTLLGTKNYATETYADTAEADAISTAAADATTKANAALASAQSYADTAEADAISTAAATAASLDTAQTTAITTAYQTYADQAEADAISTAAADATTKADAARAAAVSDVTNGAGAAFDTLKEIQDAMATDAELSAAISGLTIGDGTMTVTAGAGMTGGGSFTANQTGNSSVTLNAIAGNGITVNANDIAMSGSFTGGFTATGDITAYSDESLKTNIQTIDNALNRVEAVRGVTFERLEDGSVSTGVVAQELNAVLPEAVHTDANGLHHVAYGNITGLLIEAVKELSAEVKELKK